MAGNRLGAISLWTVRILLAAVFLFAGGAKLAGVERMNAIFEQIGWGMWWQYTTGGVEIIGAALLLVTPLVGWGAFLLTCTMIGAVLTHLFLIGGSPVPALVLGLLAATVLWIKRGQLPIVGPMLDGAKGDQRPEARTGRA